MLLKSCSIPYSTGPIKVFYSYSHKDLKFKDTLEVHLKILERKGLIVSWYDQKIRVGEWENQIDEHINTAGIILLLISPDYIASEYCFCIEMKRALERHDSGKAIVIPIILRPVDWNQTDIPFAKLQVLPEDCKPVSTYQDLDQAFANIATNIRKIVEERDLITSRIILQRRWLVKITGVMTEFDKKRIDDIVCRFRELSGGNTINLVDVKAGSVVLNFESSENSFLIIEQLFRKGELSARLGITVEDIILVTPYGAAIHTTSTTNSLNRQIGREFSRTDLMVFPSDNYHPPVLKAMSVPHNNPFSFEFIFDSGHCGDIDLQEEKKLIRYFIAALSVPEEDIWVNLSAYEDNRMVPPELGKWELGRDLLAQDCLLKRFCASLLHADTELGEKYWNTVYNKAYELYGTCEMEVDTFQKVWVVPNQAAVYENRGADSTITIITESSLKVMCETDYLALRHNSNNTTDSQNKKEINDFCALIFKEMILPVVEREVNEGKTFKVLRQMFNSMVLATWFKKTFKVNPNVNMLIENPGFWRQGIVKLGEGKLSKNPVDTEKLFSFSEKAYKELGVIDLQIEDIDLNKTFYEEYIELFQNGIYNIVRRHLVQRAQKVITRRYFSGGIKLGTVTISKYHLSNIKDFVRI